MSDLPHQGLLQQAHARPISGEHLEVLGKQASAKWTSGECETMNDAVVETVKHAGLSPEQVKRVIEFANTDAYLREFKKEGSHKCVDFGEGGPANPSDVLKDLNDGGGGSVFDRGTSDYNDPPKSKTASSDYLERQVKQAFVSSEEALLPLHNPYGDVQGLREELIGAYEKLGSSIEELEIQYAGLADHVYGQMKQATMEGHSLGEVVQVWGVAAPSPEYVKVAFQLFTPRLLREGVFHSVEKIEGSLTKTASDRVVNEDSELVHDFRDFCTTLAKLAEQRTAREEVRVHVAELTSFLKQASGAEAVGKAARKAWDTATHLSGRAGEHTTDFLRGAGVPGAGLVGKGVEYLPHAAAGLGALDVRNHMVNSPTYHRVMELVPGTEDNQRHQMELRGY